MTEWKDIPGKPGYQAGSNGLIKTVKRGQDSLKALHHRAGYPTVCLFVDGKRSFFYVHLLVLEAFVGPRPDGMEACHNNGVRSDARPDNLRWDTRKNNHADKAAHGKRAIGERNGGAKLSESEAIRAIQMRNNGLTCKVVAAELRVSPMAISLAHSGKTWPHLAQHRVRR